MRKLAWFTLGVGAGIGTGIWLLGGHWLWIVALAVAAFGVTAILLSGACQYGKRVGFVLAGCAAGMLWMAIYQQMYMQPAKAVDNSYRDLQITVSDYGTLTEFGTNAQGAISLDNRKYTVKFYLDEQVELQPGDRVLGNFFLRYTGYEAELSATYHQGDGILLLAYADATVQVRSAPKDLNGFVIQRLRYDLKELIQSLFPEETAGFAKALLLGDSSDISREDDEALRDSGIRHIIAVSGLHISILFSVVQLVLGKRKWLCALVGLPVLAVFALMAGLTPSVVRACVMQAIMILGALLRKDYDSITALSVAVLLILGVNPLSLTSVGFQLSVGAVLGVMLFSGPIQKRIWDQNWMQKLKKGKGNNPLTRWCVKSVATSVSALALTLPMNAYYFGIISTVSVLANLLTLWVISYVLCGLVISCVVGAIWLPFGSMLAMVVSVPMRYVLWVARVLSNVPYGAINAENPYIIVWIVLIYVLALAQFLQHRKGMKMTLLCLLVSFSAALALTVAENNAEHYRATVLDVGQGQCVILQSGESCYVVDCGGDNAMAAANLAANTLKKKGINKIDGLILTHFDEDHAGGAVPLIAQIQVDAVYAPNADSEEPIRLSLEQAYGQKIKWVYKQQHFSFADAQLHIYPAEYGAEGNESSMCILFQGRNCDILITGDKGATAERSMVDELDLPQIDVLIAGHHGAPNSTSIYLLQNLKPKVAVISVGRNNSFGHPSQDVLHRLEMFACKILRTDQQGTIIFRG